MERPRLHRGALVGAIEVAVWRHRVTLLTAGAGWGKSEAIRQWRAESPHRDRIFEVADDWGALARALAVGDPRFGELGDPRGRRWVDDFAALARTLDRDVAVVIDDDGATGDERRARVAAGLIERRARIRFVISSRRPPGLAIARMRSQAQVAEFGAAQLAFARSELEAIAASLSPDAAELDQLASSTQGWPAGVMLALRAGTLAPRGDRPEFVDYFAEEVLAGLPPAGRRALLAASVLEAFSEPLFHAVAGDGADGGRLLDELVARNAFVQPLDRPGRWFRLHPLFREALRRQSALDRRDERIAHRRAAAWYVAHHAPERAVAHLLAAGDEAEASDLIVSSYWRMLDIGRTSTVLNWIDTLPQSRLRSDSRLVVARASAQLFEGHTGDAAASLALAESLPGSPAGVDHPSTEAGIALGRATMSALRGDVPAALEWALRAQRLHDPEHLHHLANCEVIIAGSAYYSAEVRRSEHLLRGIVESRTPVRNSVAEVAALALLARLAAAEGRLAIADGHLAQAAERLASRWAVAPFAERMLELCRAAVLQARRDGQAAEHYRRAHALALGAADRVSAADAAIGLAELAVGDRDLAGAEEWRAWAFDHLASCEDPGAHLRARFAALEHAVGELAASPADGVLTSRQVGVVRLIADGLSNAAIAATLGVSERTVHAHVRDILARLGVSDRHRAVEAYRRKLGESAGA